MDEVEVEVVHAQRGKGLLGGGDGRRAPAHVRPLLGRHEHVLALHARQADALADARLVAVDRGGVDVPIAQFEGLSHGVAGDVAGRRLPRPVAYARDSHAVRKLEARVEAADLFVDGGPYAVLAVAHG